METSSERTVPGLHEPLERAARARDWSDQLLEMARAVARQGNDLLTVGTFALECLIEALGFERGFLLAESVDMSDDDGQVLFDVLTSRRCLDDGRETTWSTVRNAEFAVNATVVQRALASSDPLVIDDCLVRSGPDGEVCHRAVLCRAFPLSAETRGVVYLERGLGLDEVSAAQREAFDLFVDWCTPVLGKAFLWREVRALRERVREDESDEDESAEESGAESLLELDDVPAGYYGIIGTDPKLQRIFEIAEKVKDSDLNVCIFGESGTGKELIARAIHAAGSRRDRPFVSENCGAISETLLESELFGHVKGAFTGADEDRKGLFELAHRGTLFLDEVGDMSEGMQRKLLRALQEGEIRPIGGKEAVHVDVRVICASNRDLQQLVQQGTFRADLYYRLNVISIEVPPLRERRGDIIYLLSRFAAEIMEEEGIRKRFSPSAVRALVQYGWPGNARELRNVMRRVILTSRRRVIARKDVLPFLATGARGVACLGENVERQDEHLVLRIPARDTFNEIIDECERLVLLNALREAGWNKSRVTKLLGIPRQSLYNKIAKHDIQRPARGR